MMVGKNQGSLLVVQQIPENSVGAELGVWRGDTSARFLASGKIKHLHLVDAWSPDPYYGIEGYREKYAKLVGSGDLDAFRAYYDAVLAGVRRRFQGQPVTIHQTTVHEFLTEPPEDLDWVYVDASHEYLDVLDDLERCARHVDLIFGDDYGNKPGVVRAVDEFDRTHPEWHLQVLGKNQYRLDRKV